MREIHSFPQKKKNTGEYRNKRFKLKVASMTFFISSIILIFFTGLGTSLADLTGLINTQTEQEEDNLVALSYDKDHEIYKDTYQGERIEFYMTQISSEIVSLPNGMWNDIENSNILNVINNSSNFIKKVNTDENSGSITSNFPDNANDIEEYQKKNNDNQEANKLSQEADELSQKADELSQEADELSQKEDELSQEADGLSQKEDELSQEADKLSQETDELSQEVNELNTEVINTENLKLDQVTINEFGLSPSETSPEINQLQPDGNLQNIPDSLIESSDYEESIALFELERQERYISELLETDDDAFIKKENSVTYNSKETEEKAEISENIEIKADKETKVNTETKENTKTKENTETKVNTEASKNAEAEKTEESSKKTSAESTSTSSSTTLTMKYNKKMDITLSKSELAILQRIVEAEATGEDIYGRMLVANVVLNRMFDDEFPDTIKGVVFQSGQFAPTRDGRYESVTITKKTIEAVERVLCGEDYSSGALYFFARSKTTTTKAKWFDNTLKKLFKYGGHEFYKEK